MLNGIGLSPPHPILSTTRATAICPKMIADNPAAIPTRGNEYAMPVMITMPSKPETNIIGVTDLIVSQCIWFCLKNNKGRIILAAMPPTKLTSKPVLIAPNNFPAQLLSVPCIPIAIPLPTAITRAMIIPFGIIDLMLKSVSDFKFKIMDGAIR